MPFTPSLYPTIDMLQREYFLNLETTAIWIITSGSMLHIKQWPVLKTWIHFLWKFKAVSKLPLTSISILLLLQYPYLLVIIHLLIRMRLCNP